MIFGDNDTLTGFVIPMEHKTDLKKKFNIKKMFGLRNQVVAILLLI